MSILRSESGVIPRLLLGSAAVLALGISTCVAQQPAPVAPASPEPTATGQEQPLGTVARNSKKPAGSKVTRVITEDDMDAAANILPKLRMDGAENSDEIIAAIGEYKASHSPEETEDVVQAWYERYDQDLAAAIQQNSTVNSLREENWSNGNEICREGGDWQKCEGRRRAEHHDRVRRMKFLERTFPHDAKRRQPQKCS